MTVYAASVLRFRSSQLGMGLHECMAVRPVSLEFADGSLGLALNLESQTVGAVRFASSFGTQTCTEGSLGKNDE